MRRRRRRSGSIVRGLLLMAGAAIGSASVLSLALAADRTVAPMFAEALRAPRFQIRAVHWLGLRSLTANVLMPHLKITPNTPLLDIDVKRLCERVSKHPRVQACHALRVPPNRMVIRVRERDPVGRIAGTSDVFDVAGTRFPMLGAADRTLPAVRGDVGGAVPLLLALRAREIEIEALEVRNRDDLRFRFRGSEVLVRTGSDAERALEDWAQLRSAGALERFRPKEVDLRFKGSAVLRGARKKTEGGESVTSRRTDRRS